MKPSYQLTKHPLGSIREFWAMSWPLMIGLMSSTLMMFADRLFLSRFDPMALNAAASGGIAYYMFLVMPMGVAAISEVLVGRLHGENSCARAGSSVWQFIHMALLSLPVFLLISWAAPGLIFFGSGNTEYETAYFSTLMLFGPAQLIQISLAGFFIAIGSVRIVTITALIGNAINIILDWLLIFGAGSIPALGVEGASLATGIAQSCQVLLLLLVFLSSGYRKEYGTASIGISRGVMKEGLSIGMPSGLGHLMEVICHFLFFRMIMSVSQEQMSLVAMVQSFYVLSSFIIEAESKAAGAIASNLLGGKAYSYLGKVLKSAFSLHTLFSSGLMLIAILFPGALLKLFLAEENVASFTRSGFDASFTTALFYMSLFFLLDGLSWILIGFIQAAGDTRYIFYVSASVHWIAYILPTAWLIYLGKGGADVAWMIIASMSFFTFSLYFIRYWRGSYLKAYQASV
ncbi:MATE family efflux transporter [Estrella lausannensis]|uniref:Putative membrane protein n=1 Tax=Estrella lausannensis TaxID=483423 RepID=A0A0H5DS81_9BACT|nr:MATE family efflux transporter [Estrella lausannensis]CRX39552.1 putative membrane protein [Estrella lausannensis]